MLKKILFLLTIFISYSYAQVQPLQCDVCVNAWKNEIGLNNENAVQFALNAPMSCIKASTDPAQEVSCISTFTQNAKTLFKNSQNPKTIPEAICATVGSVGAPCTTTPTSPPTKPPTY